MHSRESRRFAGHLSGARRRARRLRQADTADDPREAARAVCPHAWPVRLTYASRCLYPDCELPYDEYTEHLRSAA